MGRRQQPPYRAISVILVALPSPLDTLWRCLQPDPLGVIGGGLWAEAVSIIPPPKSVTPACIFEEKTSAICGWGDY